MDDFFLYLIKVVGGTVILYLFYILFFSRETFYLRNRIFLISVLLLPLLVPLIKTSDFSNPMSTVVASNQIMKIISSGNEIDTAVSENIISFNFFIVLKWIYIVIGLFVLFSTIVGVFRTVVIIKKGTVQDDSFPKLILSDIDHPAFSFFPFIVLPRKLFQNGDYADILKHEKAHIRLCHTFDLMLSALLVAFQWFNPVIWLIKKSIILNHEYQADSISIKNTNDKKAYQYKLLNIPAQLIKIPFAHNFSSLLKNRLVMLNKRPTSSFAALKNILIVPLVVVLTTMFSFRPEITYTQESGQETAFANSSEILQFLAQNIVYPKEAKANWDTGRVYVSVKMLKGGVIKECKAYNDRKKLKVPYILDEFIIVAYGPLGQPGINTQISQQHPALNIECLRVANQLGSLNVPGWKDKDREFGLAFKFVLK